MTEYVKLTHQLTRDQWEALRKLSFETRKSQSELVRVAVDRMLAEDTHETK